MDLRIERAMRLLRTTDLSIAQIADSVGCSNGGFLTKIFKEKLHILPSEYRKQEKNTQNK
jgi:transcriptional regulator GlxA family with amidase domain